MPEYGFSGGGIFHFIRWSGLTLTALLWMAVELNFIYEGLDSVFAGSLVILTAKTGKADRRLGFEGRGGRLRNQTI